VEEVLKEMKKRCIELRGKEKSLLELKVNCDKIEVTRQEYETEDERLNSLKDNSHKKSKDLGKTGKLEEKARVDKEQRQISKDIDTNNDKLELAQETTATLTKFFMYKKQNYAAFEQELAEWQKKFAAERAVQYSIKPKKPIGNKCLEIGVLPQLSLKTLCPVCNLFFISNSLVPYFCGCLFHPWYLWPKLLSRCQACPRYKNVGGFQWLEL